MQTPMGKELKNGKAFAKTVQIVRYTFKLVFGNTLRLRNSCCYTVT